MKEIIVVNDGSADNTEKVLEVLVEHTITPVRVIRHPQRRGVQNAKMAGVAEADTKWVLLGEDDVWLGKNYINTLLREAEKLGAEIIAGRILNVNDVSDDFDPSTLRDDDAPFLDDIVDIKHFIARFDAHSKGSLAAPFVHGVALVRSSVFDRVGFDAKYLGTAHREETDFCLAARGAGFSVYWTPATECYHLRGAISLTGGHRGRKLNWMKIEFWGFVNTWMLIKKHWHLLCERYGFEGSPLSWFISIYCKERFLLYFERILSGRISKTWSKK